MLTTIFSTEILPVQEQIVTIVARENGFAPAGNDGQGGLGSSDGFAPDNAVGDNAGSDDPRSNNVRIVNRGSGRTDKLKSSGKYGQKRKSSNVY